MAILVEEQQRRTNWITIVSVIVIVSLLFAVAYYVFFKNPGTVDQIVAPNLATVGQLSKVNVNPQEVIDLPSFRILNDFSAPLVIPSAGRNNPFRPL